MASMFYEERSHRASKSADDIAMTKKSKASDVKPRPIKILEGLGEEIARVIVSGPSGP